MKVLRLAAIVILAVSAAAAHASPIYYTFSSPVFDVSFTEPSILTEDTVIPASSLLTNNTPNLLSVEINPSITYCNARRIIDPNLNSCVFFSLPGMGLGYFFSSQLTSLGTFTTGNTKLVISQTAANSVAPEPSSLVLLVTGLSGLVSLAVKGRRTTIKAQ